MTGRRLVAASESAPSEADPSHDCAEGAVSEAGWIDYDIGGPIEVLPGAADLHTLSEGHVCGLVWSPES